MMLINSKIVASQVRRVSHLRTFEEVMGVVDLATDDARRKVGGVARLIMRSDLQKPLSIKVVIEFNLDPAPPKRGQQ